MHAPKLEKTPGKPDVFIKEFPLKNNINRWPLALWARVHDSSPRSYRNASIPVRRSTY